jgi:hypothetical protein
MGAPSSEYSESRPYKIFISLLDKWEIGGPLTDSLVLDAFESLKVSIESDSHSKEEVSALVRACCCDHSFACQLSLTASTLYEAVEPQAVWKHLLSGIITEVIVDGSRLRV